jgi:linoleoyl-CoA desaturase
MHHFARAMEVAGRTILHFSFEPITFTLGVFTLFLSKQVDATEIGHTVLHGAYDKVDTKGKFQSRKYWWPAPIDEESWRRGHNVRHHMNTNIAGKDPDVEFGPVRLTERTPHRPEHYIQLPFTLFALFPNFAFLMNLHFTGVVDLIGPARHAPPRILEDRSPESKRQAWRRLLRKYVPYYAKEYVLFPLLAGPFFWKVMLGNWISEVMRDVYSAATIYCGHVGEAKHYGPDHKPRNRGEWYAMQVEASNDFEVSWPVSVLCGALDRQIEHHLFPGLPTQRIREIAPEVRRICEEHGVEYRSDTWPSTLKKALKKIAALSKPDGTGLMGGVHATIEAMT